MKSVNGENLSIELWRADAIVLYDWLMSVDFTKIPITHRAQRQALMDLLTQLDVTDASQVSRDDIADAQERVARDMGW